MHAQHYNRQQLRRGLFSFLAARICDNRILSKEFVAEHQARRSCAAMCGVNYGCFGFNSLVEKCRIHHSCDPVDMTSVKNGWRYYLIDRKYLIKYYIKCMFRNQSKLYIYLSSHLSIKSFSHL